MTPLFVTTQIRDLVWFRVIFDSQERHFGSHIVEFYNARDESA
jgi:hypothetical protein